MPFCAKCGTQLSAGIAFCQNCGSPVSGGSAASTTRMSGLPAHPQPTQIPCTTAFSISGYRIVKELGIVRGLTVRTRGIGGRFQAGVSAIVGGKVDAYIDMCEQARSEALQHMIDHAHAMGANAVIGMRYDTTEIAEGMDEVLAYGTAVVVEPS
jgi:uncharacterized protein YbjQ (UPF0145 family)